MATITRECPHCCSENTTFNSFAEFVDPSSKMKGVYYLVAFECGSCHGGYFVRVERKSGGSPHDFNGNLELSTELSILEEYPKTEGLEAPKYIPDNLRSFFFQAVHNVRARNHDASAMMSRKVLEVAVKLLNSNGNGSLYNRIEQLYEQGRITTELKNWAHIIRGDGNQAAHEEEMVSQEFAQELIAFVEIFLMYTFSMPGMIESKMNSSKTEA